jgi:hypothetical protein
MNFKGTAILFLLFLTMFHCFCQEIKTDSLEKFKAKPFAIPNTDIIITPPVHFKYVDNIKGFVHLGTSASINIVEIDQISYLQIIEGLTPEYFAKQNATIIGVTDVVTQSGMNGKLYTLGFSINSNDSSKKVLQFEKMMLFTGDYHHTIWVSANYPVMLKKVLYMVMRDSMLSAKFKEPEENKE